MKTTLALAVAFALGATSAATAGMQGQGAKPDAKGPEYTEKNPGGYRDQFKKMDVDKDGFLTRQDLVGPRAKEMSKQWSKIDKNKDDKLNKSEFSAFETKAPAASDRSPEAPAGVKEGRGQ
jgi:hypothetical protein